MIKSQDWPVVCPPGSEWAEPGRSWPPTWLRWTSAKRVSGWSEKRSGCTRGEQQGWLRPQRIPSEIVWKNKSLRVSENKSKISKQLRLIGVKCLLNCWFSPLKKIKIWYFFQSFFILLNIWNSWHKIRQYRQVQLTLLHYFYCLCLKKISKNPETFTFL